MVLKARTPRRQDFRTCRWIAPICNARRLTYFTVLCRLIVCALVFGSGSCSSRLCNDALLIMYASALARAVTHITRMCSHTAVSRYSCVDLHEMKPPEETNPPAPVANLNNHG